MIINQIPICTLGMLTLVSLMLPGDAQAEDSKPKCKVIVHNCHSSTKLLEVRTYNAVGDFNTLIAADSKANLSPGQNTTLYCESGQTHCETYATMEKTVGFVGLSKDLADREVGPAQTSCNSEVAFGKNNVEGLYASQNCNSVPTGAGQALPSGKFNASLIAEHSGKCIDGNTSGNGVNVYQWDCHHGANQTFEFSPVAGKASIYTLKFAHSGQCLDGTTSSDNGSNLHQWDCHGGANQQFKIEEVLNGNYRLVVQHSNKVVDVSTNSNGNGDNIHQWDWADNANQKWSIYVR